MAAEHKRIDKNLVLRRHLLLMEVEEATAERSTGHTLNNNLILEYSNSPQDHYKARERAYNCIRICY